MIYKYESPDILFETSWEVCNKVGGIYTVLSTKAKTLHKLYKDNVIFIGPDVWTDENPSPYFIESEPLLNEWKDNAVFPLNMTVKVGRWDIPGKPIVILVNYKSLEVYKNQLYAEMWNKYRVDSLHAYGDYDESCMFAYGAALVIESILLWKPKKNPVAHFDEWTTGMGLLYLKSRMPNVATVFTTHATSIGRSICGNNKPLYDYMHNYDGDQMAQQLNMQSKHSLEKATAMNADSFTTVSDVTAVECEQLLTRRPDMVTKNGFEENFVPSPSKYVAARKKARKALLNVASHLIGHQVNDDAFLIATSGRNEFRNKGLDLFISAINKLRIEKRGTNREIIAFILVPAWVYGPREDLSNSLQSKDFNHLVSPQITHHLNNYSEDAIFSDLNYLGIHNSDHENVKVIYIPSYLDGNDGILNLSYYEMLPGIDATAFPSYYEPWGYTPLESIAFGVPTITTDLSGFGQWILSTFKNEFSACGVNVLHRTDSNYDSVVNDLSDSLMCLADMSDDEMKKVKQKAIVTSKEASWGNFIENYVIAYDNALKVAHKRTI